MEGGTRPEYIIPVSSSDGVWGMVKRVGRFNAEGWLALFKGKLSTRPTIILDCDIIFRQGCSRLA
jgi:fusion and transport protein UGO1